MKQNYALQKSRTEKRVDLLKEILSIQGQSIDQNIRKIAVRFSD